jgi:hypothetical protein
MTALSAAAMVFNVAAHAQKTSTIQLFERGKEVRTGLPFAWMQDIAWVNGIACQRNEQPTSAKNCCANLHTHVNNAVFLWYYVLPCTRQKEFAAGILSLVQKKKQCVREREDTCGFHSPG